MSKKDFIYRKVIELEGEINKLHKQCMKLKKQVDLLYNQSCRAKNK